MRLPSAGLAALLWSTLSSVTTASPVADNININNNNRPMPVLRPRQTGGGTGATPTPTPTTAATTPTTATSATGEEEATTTVTITTTVGGTGGGGVVTATTVFLRTITTTVLVTSTSFETTTVTSNDVATATVTNYVTSTVLARRSLQVLPLDAPVPAAVPAAGITPAAVAYYDDLLVRRKHAFVEKRALVTVVVTVTGSAAGVSTVLNTRTSTVVFTTTSNTAITSTLTSTQFNNAQTTITVESTLTVTSTSIDTASPSTVDTGPTTGSLGTATQTEGAQSTGGSGSSGDGSDGLSTGAKAGIGAAVGVVGLAALIGVAWWAYRRHKANRPSRSDLDDMRAYDPNGPSPLHTPAGMSETTGGFGGAGAGTMRRQPVPKHQLSPPSQSVSPLSNQTVSPANDFGAGGGYARPPAGGAQELGGTRIMPAEMGGGEVVEMGDSQPRPQQPLQHTPAPGMAYNSGPVPDVYEMPSERYR
ncbi:hypothetical protein CH63R_12206 [Colletotrichum higginsianum IMI 349063]|uniref:Uncharacterized protein n=2 Tax=Colletotrichum higginsianum TaxID=80884 RepID=A0A1B7Y0H3_COLHI|nr:hypothetical protein CH63R_12206 [Colletotrichum higginsianum IMI 349063]OBR05503.1 hypothetical protein CH63R_12206 [Colletotrichum higginsianum IMI 349063]TIC94089.1 hypothetical protein CH35J_009859 [Colletotrichum higginsianum]